MSRPTVLGRPCVLSDKRVYGGAISKKYEVLNQIQDDVPGIQDDKE